MYMYMSANMPIHIHTHTYIYIYKQPSKGVTELHETIWTQSTSDARDMLGCTVSSGAQCITRHTRTHALHTLGRSLVHMGIWTVVGKCRREI